MVRRLFRMRHRPWIDLVRFELPERRYEYVVGCRDCDWGGRCATSDGSFARFAARQHREQRG